MKIKNYLIALNPLPNKQKEIALNELLSELKRQSLSYRIYETAPNLKANQVFFEKNLSQFSDVIVLGGDGTLNLIANCMAFNDTPIGIIPCGTGNDFVKTLFEHSSKSTVEIALGRKSKWVDLGQCNDRYFLNILGVGFDGELAKQLERSHLARFKKLTYLLKTLFLIPRYKEQEIKMEFDGWKVSQTTFLAAFANGKYFGSGMKLAPHAELSNGKLDYCIVEKCALIKKLYYLSKIFSGKHLSSPAVSYDKVSQAKIETPGIPIQADGDFIGLTPCKINIHNNGLKIKY